MTRILLLSPLFLGLSNFFASITQVYKRFVIYAVSPLLYNFGIIIGVLVFYPIFGLVGLAYGVILGAFCHFIIQVPFVVEKGLFPKLTWDIHFQAIKRVVFLSLPRTLTASSNEIAEFFLITLAGVMSSGSISVFNLSFNLQSVPLSIIGVSYSLAAFPALARHFTSGRQKEFVEQMVTSAKHIIFLSLPVTALFIVLRAQIVRVILGSGHFSWTDTRLTAAALALWSISLIPQSLMLLFVRSYYSRGRTRKPLIINAVSSVFLLVFAYFMTGYFIHASYFRYFIESLLKVDSLRGTEVLMLPFAFSLVVTLNMIAHWIDFSFDYPAFSMPVLKTFFQSLGGSVIMGAVTYFFLTIFGNLFALNTVLGIFLQGFLAGIIGIAVYIIILKLLKSAELSEVWYTLHQKIFRTKIIVPEITK